MHRCFYPAFGEDDEAVRLFEQLLYLQEAEADGEGWVLRTEEQLRQEAMMKTDTFKRRRKQFSMPQPQLGVEEALLEFERVSGNGHYRYRLTPYAFRWARQVKSLHSDPRKKDEGAGPAPSSEDASNAVAAETRHGKTHVDAVGHGKSLGPGGQNPMPGIAKPMPDMAKAHALPTVKDSREFRDSEDTHAQPSPGILGRDTGSEDPAGVCVSEDAQAPSLREALMGACAVGEAALRSKSVRRELDRVEGEWRTAGMTPDRVKLWLHWFKTVEWRDDRTRPDPPKLKNLTPERLDRFQAWETKQQDRRRRGGEGVARKLFGVEGTPDEREERRRRDREARENVTAALRESGILKPMDPVRPCADGANGHGNNGHGSNGNGHAPTGGRRPKRFHLPEGRNREEAEAEARKRGLL